MGGKLSRQIRAGVVNFHFAQNHGAVLQALALQDRLEQRGIEVTIIDYRPRGHWQQYAVRPNPVLSAGWKYRGSRAEGLTLISSLSRAAKRALRSVLSWRSRPEREQRLRAFEAYTSKHLHLSQTVRSYRDIQDAKFDFDLLVTGSDQVWNPTNTGGLDPVYYLGFDTVHSATRVAYAVSPVQLELRRHEDALRPLLARLDHISLREGRLQSEISRISGKDAQVVPDPVLLMSSSDLTRYSSGRVPSHPYIVLYTVRTPSTYASVEAAMASVRSRYGLQIVDISLEPNSWSFEVSRPVDLSPGDFLSLIASADFVVSNSFHATAFALLFERDFAVATEPSTSERLFQVLDAVGLVDRIVDEPSKAEAAAQPIDFVDVRPKLDALRASGERYLDRAIADVKSRVVAADQR